MVRSDLTVKGVYNRKISLMMHTLMSEQRMQDRGALTGSWTLSGTLVKDTSICTTKAKSKGPFQMQRKHLRSQSKEFINRNCK